MVYLIDNRRKPLAVLASAMKRGYLSASGKKAFKKAVEKKLGAKITSKELKNLVNKAK